MSFSLRTTVMAAVFINLLPIISHARISPDIRTLLTVASEKNDGVSLDLVTELAIAAAPGNEKDIRIFVASLKQRKTEISPAPSPMPDYFTRSGWDGEIDLNFLRSSGNTRQQSLGLAGKLHRDSGRYHHTIRSYLDLNKNTGVTDKQKWGISYKLDHDFSEKLYITSFVGYEYDQFGAFRERITTSVGLGYPIIKTDHYDWKVEGGPGLLLTKDLPGVKYNKSFSAFGSSIFDWTINDRSSFTNITKIYIGNKNIIDSRTTLKVKINGSLSSKFSYNIMYDHNAPLDRRKTDTVARAGLSYDF